MCRSRPSSFHVVSAFGLSAYGATSPNGTFPSHYITLRHIMRLARTPEHYDVLCYTGWLVNVLWQNSSRGALSSRNKDFVCRGRSGRRVVYRATTHDLHSPVSPLATAAVPPLFFPFSRVNQPGSEPGYSRRRKRVPLNGARNVNSDAMSDSYPTVKIIILGIYGGVTIHDTLQPPGMKFRIRYLCAPVA